MFYLMEILKLDSALEVLYLHKDTPSLSVNDIRKKIPFRVPHEEVAMMLDKMQDDHLVSKKKKNAAEGFFITYVGMKFYQKGGYLKALIRSFFKKAVKLLLVALGAISTIIGIALGLRELL